MKVVVAFYWPALPQCSGGSGYSTTGEQCYYTSNMASNWFEARLRCRHRGGDLATISSAVVHDLVTNIVRQQASSQFQFWVGLTRGEWRWPTGGFVRSTGGFVRSTGGFVRSTGVPGQRFRGTRYGHLSGGIRTYNPLTFTEPSWFLLLTIPSIYLPCWIRLEVGTFACLTVPISYPLTWIALGDAYNSIE